MADTTRDQFLAAATRLFSERGFYGVSIAAIADELGLTKQALLHHFGSKERIYRDVLDTIGLQLIADIESRKTDPVGQLEGLLMAMVNPTPEHQTNQRLILRELLDNQARLKTADTWYLKPYLDRLIDLYLQIPGKAGVARMDALAVLYHLIGAASYFGVSEDTLSHMYGASRAEGLKAARPEAFRRLVRAALSPE